MGDQLYPSKGVNADIKMMYDFNFRNGKTRTRSGQAFHADYALEWAFGNGWVIGLVAITSFKQRMMTGLI